MSAMEAETVSLDQWTEVFRERISFSLKSFWVVMRLYLKHPNYVYPRIAFVETTLVSGPEIEDSAPVDPADQNVNQQSTVLTRKIYSKALAADNELPLEDSVFYDRPNRRVEYVPNVPAGEKANPAERIPLYYPKVKKFSFAYEVDEVTGETYYVFRAVYFEDYSFFHGDYKETMAKVAKSNFARFSKWAVKEDKEAYKKHAEHDVLVPHKQFHQKYQEMKKKYRFWAANWPEKTSPQKFVYEELAIAAFLVCLWENERKELNTDKMQSFIDLGCGNGFLVNLLVNEGYEGKGIDISKRKIWNIYGQHGKQPELIQEALHPDKAVYDVDWLVGNHSDELTPWIPYIASRSPKTKFFLLPCCFFDFEGKYQQKANDLGRYHTYLKFVENISAKCGFTFSREALRIPSTKNIVIISTGRNYDVNDPTASERVEKDRSRLLKNFSGTFEPRQSDKEKTEKVKEKKQASLENRKKRKLEENRDPSEQGLNIGEEDNSAAEMRAETTS